MSPAVRRTVTIAGLALLLAAPAGCSSGPGHPTPTGATCPPEGTDLTYDNFGKPFMEAYCVRCHSSELKGAARMGAPIYHDFDSKIGILNVAAHVDREAAAGPDAIDRFMPPNGDAPTDQERYDLGTWLACEEQAIEHPPDAGVSDASDSPDAGSADASDQDAGADAAQ